MSLIRDALREMGPEEQTQPTLAPYPGQGRQQTAGALSSGHKSLLWLALGVLILLGSAWWLWGRSPDQAQLQAQAQPQPQSQPQALSPSAPALAAASDSSDLADPGVPPAEARAETSEAMTAAETPEPAAASATLETIDAEATVEANTEASTVANTAAEAAASITPTPQATAPRTRSQHRPVAAATATPAATPAAPPPPPLRKTHALFSQALALGDLAAAREQLNVLEQTLPAESITLLRARAWYQTQAEDAPAAEASYQDILSRLPGDENASLNLAALAVTAGRIGTARQLLTDALHENPESPALRQAINQLAQIPATPAAAAAIR